MAAVSLDNVQVISESLAPVNGAIAGCGQAAVLMMNHIVSGQRVDANELVNLIKFSIATGHSVDTRGATRPSDLQWLAEQSGVKTKLGGGASWRSTVDTALPQGKPVVLGVANARAFGGADSNVRGHYVTIVGSTTDNRYIVADPNQQAAKTGGTVIYSASQIQDARPFATLTPVQGSQRNLTLTGGQETNGGCQYSIGLPGGANVCMDPFVDGVIRAALIMVGVILIIIAILIFTRKDIPKVAEGTAHAAEVAAL